MNKIFVGLMCAGLLFSQSSYYGSTTAPVVIAGGIIKARHIQEVSVKYKRKDCPVCKGKGWYMSGDGILKIECTYCEADKGVSEPITLQPTSPLVPYQAPSAKDPNCANGQCKPYTILRR